MLKGQAAQPVVKEPGAGLPEHEYQPPDGFLLHAGHSHGGANRAAFAKHPQDHLALVVGKYVCHRVTSIICVYVIIVHTINMPSILAAKIFCLYDYGMEKLKRGRPPKAPDESLAERLDIRLSTAERQE